MIKTAFAAAAAVAFAAPGAALAGPYVNVEANSGFTGSDYTGTTTDAHVGYAGSTGAVSYGVQLVLLSSSLTAANLIPFCLVRFMVALLLPRHSMFMANSPSLVASTVLTTVTAPKLVLLGPSDLNSDAIFRAVASKVGTPNWGALFQGAPFLYL